MPGRRPSLALLALFVVPLPACIHISATPLPPDAKGETKVEPKAVAKPVADAKARPQPPAGQPPKMEFAVLPRVPGTVALKNNPPPKQPNPAVEPVAPTQPGDPVRTAHNNEPGPFPFAQPFAPPPDPPLVGALRAYMDGRPERALEFMRALDRPNQEFVLSVLPLLVRGATADLNRDAVANAVLADQLHATAARLEPRAALRVEKALFCRDVRGFGRYTPRSDSDPYRPHEIAQLYLELRNLASVPANDGYATSVNALVEVRDAENRLVPQIDPEDKPRYARRVSVVKFDKVESSRSPLHDFHILYYFSVPQAPGVYTITVELRDPAGRRTTKTQPIQFCVAGP
jgi:hypothetical protein